MAKAPSMTEMPMGSRDDGVIASGTGGTTSSPMEFPVAGGSVGVGQPVANR